MKLTKSFYQRSDVTVVARELLGKLLFTNVDGVICGGRIVETEAYSWSERGCHAFDGRKTDRNAVMFEAGGTAYVYLCYGMHHMFNVVTNRQQVAEAVLIRAVEPIVGAHFMKTRRGVLRSAYQLTAGPGKLTKALGIDRKLNGKSLVDDEVWIEDVNQKITSRHIVTSPRIGIDYAGADALLPWRFYLRENPWVSKL